MALHLEPFLRASLVLGLGLVAMPLARRASATARRLVLSVAIVAAMAVPVLPAWHVDAPAYRHLVARVIAEPVEGGGAVAATSAARHRRSVDVLTLLWALGALAVAARVGHGLVAARRLVRRASAAPAWSAAAAQAEQMTGRRADVRVSDEVEVPAVAGTFSPVIVVPPASADWPETRKASVLLHELAHVEAHDLLVQLLASAACSLHWFNPLVWLASRRLRLERELAADESVLRLGVRASSYAADLLAIAGTAPPGALAIAEKPLTTRIHAILAERRPAALGRTTGAALVLAAASVSVFVACTTAADASAPSATAPTTDRELQALADAELQHALAEWKATRGTIVVLSPKGDVLAEAGDANRVYVAGSTMKPLLLASALEEGVVSESDVFDCTANARAGKVLNDASKLGTAPLADVLARSSNVGFAQVFDRLGAARYDRTLRLLHFATPAGFASAPAGDWDATLTAIGATMSTTPRQVARAYAVLADGGDGVVGARTAARVTALLEGVVATENGTGRRARIDGVRVAGKTATSEWKTPEGATATYASFVGWVPAEHPRFVVFVGVESPVGDKTWGGAVAAPVFARVAARALAR